MSAPLTGTGAGRYEHLMTPLMLRGGLRLRNRAVVTAHGTGLSSGGVPSERLIAYHRARARGGAGLIIVEHNSVHPTSRLLHGSTINSFVDAVIEPYTRLADAVHREGAAIFTQLSHAGMQSGAIADRGYVVGPSPDGTLRPDAPVRALTADDIDELVDAYAAAARRIVAGGLDGVEVHLGHGNLLQQFLSPLTNRRCDEYGGDSGGRLRFPARVVSAVAEAVGGLEIGLRVSADELVPGGLSCDQTIALMRDLICETGVTPSYINVSAGQDMSALSAGLHQSPMYIPNGHLVPFAKRYREALSPIPIICIGRITTPQLAEDVLVAGEADLVGMTRAHIADPYLIAKASAGEEHEIVPCIACNVACLGRLERGAHVTCIQNPASGRESTLEHRLSHARRSGRRIAIVGAGPAGLEAAVSAGRAGHEVVLFEAGEEPGGLALAAARLPGRAEVGKVVSYRLGVLSNFRNVELRCGQAASIEMICEQEPELVVLATGSRMSDGTPPGCCPPEEIALGESSFPSDAVSCLVYDGVGDVLGAGLAELMSVRGLTTRLAYRAVLPMPNVERGMRAVVLERLARAGVAVEAGVETPQPAQEETLVRVDPRRPQRSLLEALKGSGLRCEVVGDALVPRGFEHAILEGRMAIIRFQDGAKSAPAREGAMA